MWTTAIQRSGSLRRLATTPRLEAVQQFASWSCCSVTSNTLLPTTVSTQQLQLQQSYSTSQSQSSQQQHRRLRQTSEPLICRPQQHHWRRQQHCTFASMPCRVTEDRRLTEEDECTRDQQQAAQAAAAAAKAAQAAAIMGHGRHLPSAGGSSSSSRSGSTGSDNNDDSDDSEDEPRRRRKSTTESRAALRRTTESRGAVEDVAVMSKSQLLRRKKAWLAEQCWERKLPHDGLKDELVQRLLDWQTTEPGKQAAADAIAAAQTAMAALAASRGGTGNVTMEAAQTAAAGSADTASLATAQTLQARTTTHQSGSAGEAVAAAAAGDFETGIVQPSMADAATSNGTEIMTGSSSGSTGSNGSSQTAAVRRRRRHSTGAAAPASDGTTGSAEDKVQDEPAASEPAAAQVVQQPPRNAAAAAAETRTVLLQQLQEQPDNAALVAVARNALEVYARGLDAQHSSSSSSSDGPMGAADAAEAVQQLAAELVANSTPKSLAALAKACYSREVQSPVLAAAVAEAVAAVAPQLGPHEVYGVLRLLVEHLGQDDGQVLGASSFDAGFKAMMKGFKVLAEGMIRYSAALHPRQLTEAVQLLGTYRYDDPYGLWMIAKEAADRLEEFEPADVVLLLDAVAGMCVADDALCERVGAVVSGSKDSYSQEQLQAVEAVLSRMGCTVKL